MNIFLWIILAIFLIILASNALKVIRPYQRGVVERLGKYVRTLGSGLNVIIPAIEKIEKVWKNGNGHMKIHWVFGDKKINFLFRWKGDMIKNINTNSKINVVWKIKKDDFNWGYYVNWLELIE